MTLSIDRPNLSHADIQKLKAAQQAAQKGASSAGVRHVAFWPICEATVRPIEVCSMGHSGLDLLTLSSSPFDPQRMCGSHEPVDQPCAKNGRWNSTG